MGYSYGHGYGHRWKPDKRVSTPAAIGGAGLLTGETDGFATDFTYATDASRVAVKVAGVNTSYAVDSFYSNSGTSPKQVYDAAGVLRWSPHNLDTYSENLASGSGWLLTNLTAASATQIRPTATASVTHRLGHNVTVNAGETYTYQGVFSYPPGSTYSKVGIGGGSTTAGSLSIAFDINLGTIINTDVMGAGASATIVPGPAAGQFTITATVQGLNTTGFLVYILNPIYTTGAVSAVWTATDTATGINIHRQQVNRGSVPTAYLPTTTAIRMGLAIDYDPVSHAGKGLLCEPAATNLSFRSSEFDVIWTAANGAIVTADNAIAPNGTMTADKISDDTAASSSSTVGIQNNSMTVAATTAYTFSVFVKAGTYSSIDIRTVNDDLVRGGVFDLSTQIFTPGGGSPTGVFQALPNGLYRIAMTWTTGADTAISVRVGFGGTITRDGTHNFYLWGAQMELGTIATSHIPTFAASATRAADCYQITSAQINHSATAGSWWADFDNRNTTGAATRIVSYTAGGPPPAGPLYIVNVNNMGIIDGTSLNNGISPTIGRHKAAGAFATGDRAITFDGRAVVTDAGVVTNLLAPGANIGIGSRVVVNENLNGYIYKIRYVPRRKTNPELVTETT